MLGRIFEFRKPDMMRVGNVEGRYITSSFCSILKGKTVAEQMEDCEGMESYLDELGVGSWSTFDSPTSSAFKS